jgi:mono/diheme cytochrome c family protein
MKTKIFSSAALALTLFSSLPAAAQELAAAAERGQQTFMRVGCYQCHGSNGQGNNAGPALTPETLPPQVIAIFIRSTPGRMPVYPEEVLSDNEIADIVAFLKTVPPPPSADNIDVLKDLTPTG